MKIKEENFILDSTEELLELTRENNKMLKQIIGVINHYIKNSEAENTHDFGRNVLANIISNKLFKF